MTVPRRLGPYELLELVGEGGMGEVWKARDTRLDRVVAVKVLRGEVSDRFMQDARAVSALSHPHICNLLDVGEDHGTSFLVMEYIEGATLSGPLPVRDALRYGVQIADALCAAHRAGIVHRDLKPSSVLIHRTDGVKLVDFGLGPVAGTGHAMSPEQLEGRPADTRSDVFAFGLLLYELLTGRRAFNTRSEAGVLAPVMDGDPTPMGALAPDIPPALERLIRRALEKDPERRWQTMEAVKDTLAWMADSVAAPVGTASTVSRTRRWPLVAVGLGAALAGLVLWSAMVPDPLPERLQVEVALPRELTVDFDSLVALAPNGRSFVINASKTLWLRSLEDGSLRALTGTAGATLPFWSHDGQWVAFFANGKLKKMRLPDDTPIVLADAPNPRGGAWSQAGTIVFAPQALGPLMKIDAAGGTPEPVTTLDATRQEDQHSAPVFLPGGRQFLFHARSVLKDKSTLALAAVDQPPGTPARTVVSADTGAWYAPPSRRGDGYILFVRRRNLLVQRFDVRSGQVSGETTVLARRMRVMADAVGNFSVGTRGQLMYVADSSRMNQPRWYARDGALISSVGDLGEYTTARVSPNQQLLATVRADPVDFGRSVWVLDLARNVDTQLTLAGEVDDPAWSPDSQRLAFGWSRPGEEVSNLHEMRIDRPGDPRPLVTPGPFRWPLDWSPDGRLLVFAQIDPISNFDLWVVPVDGSSEPQPVVTGPGKHNEARFSPDGRFIAYQSDAVKETRVYLTPYPPTPTPPRPYAPAQWQLPVSDGAGREPRWRRDGQELFYIANDGALMAVPIATVGGDLRPGQPVRLFGGRDSSLRVWHFDPSPDGQRFLVLTLNDNAAATPVHLVTGWQ